MLGKIMFGLLGTAALAGTYMVHEGAVRVSVDKREPGGRHLHLIVPAALLPAGMYLVPDQQLRAATAGMRPWLPAVRIASEQLARLPDAELVEVRQPGQHVHIAKRGALLVVDVESLRETVHISFPLKTTSQVARRLQELDPEI